MAGEIQLNGTSFASESGGTITVNNGTIGSSVVFPAGHIIKMEIAHDSTQKTVTATSYAGGSSTITNLSVTINKTFSSSKILIFCSANISVDTSGAGEGRGCARIIRGTSAPYTEIKDFAGVVITYDSGDINAAGASAFLQCEDTTTSTGNLTYHLEIKRAGAAASNVKYSGDNSGDFVSSISAYEVTQ